MVRKTICLLCVLLFCAMWGGAMPAFSQYLNNNQYNQLPTRKVPARVMTKIRKHAQKRYPDNNLLQQHTIDLQTKSYFKVVNYTAEAIPSQELVMIKRNAAREYPHDYVRQLVMIDKKVKAYMAETETESEKVVKPVSSE